VGASTKSDGLRLVAESLACERGGRLVFDRLSFEVKGGEALVVTGPNGAGKSSLLRQIAGLVDIAAGRLALEGADPELGLPEQVHYVGHLDALKPSMSVRETALFWSSFLGSGDVAPALEKLDLARLAELPVAYLSAGQKRRLALSRLLVAPRPVWLLDEPTVALDRASVARLVALMEAHLRGGGLIVAATHQDLGLAPIRSLDLSPAVRAA
jgi:heme exporter protein A